MLIQKNTLTKGAVVVLKLSNHPHEIIARLEEDFDAGKEVVIRRPLEAHVMQSPSGLGLGFMPFSMAARDEQIFRIPIGSLMVPPFIARDEVSKTYMEQTTSLKLP